MQKRNTNFAIRILFSFIMVFFFLFALYTAPDAKVTGLCSNCHTMHNSQQGSSVAQSGAGMGWNGSGQLSGGTLQSPMGNLLVTTCVGCHSSSTGNTIINIGGSRIPIVFNTGGYPAQPLAGGNFYYVAAGNDSYGHNVFGLRGNDYASNKDSRLIIAPGRHPSCASYNTPDITSCHQTLANNYDMMHGTPGGGCLGCHVDVFHHSDNGRYRFLSVENAHFSPGAYVTGVEDPNWEQNPGSGHNWYQGSTAVYQSGVGGNGLGTTHSITAFCTGCHNAFHGTYGTASGGGVTVYMGMNSSTTDYSGLWIRHPTDIALPTTGEYAAYNPSASYNPTVPVAWANVNTTTPSSSSGPVVMCLSCHRAHASDRPSMLRWSYNAMVAGGGGSGGCFVCHSQKN